MDKQDGQLTSESMEALNWKAEVRTALAPTVRLRYTPALM